MNANLQREELEALTEVWRLAPDVRLGQLMAHLGFMGEMHVGKSLGYIEDDELMAILYRHRTELVNRMEGAPNQDMLPPGATISISGSSTLPAPAPVTDL